MIVIPLLVTLLLLTTCWWYFKRRGLPPGPPAVPLLGCLPFLDLRRGLVDWTTDPRVTRHTLATVSMGPRDIFVINDLKIAKELFDKEALNKRQLSDWEKVLKLVNGKIRGIASTEGEDWVKQRRFGLKTLRDLGFGRRTIEEIVDIEIEEIITKLGSHSGQDYRLGSDFNIPIINVLWQLVAGYRFEDSDSQGNEVINGIQKIFTSFISLVVFPLSLSKVFRKSFTDEHVKIVRTQRAYLIDQIEKHRATLDRDNPRDFIDIYLTAMEDDEALNTDDLAISLLDFLLAGTETSSTTLKWLVLFLTLHQEVQDRCREEIREVIGDNKCTVEDIQRLPYTQATVAEVHRLAAVGPLALAHQTKSSVLVDGFSFPPNSTFMSNLQFIMRDPNNFEDPEAFNPERYKKHAALVPFGVGKRQCMGEALARNEVMLFTVGLIQRLSFLPPDCGEGDRPDPEKYHVSITRIPTDFTVKFDIRK